jgi:hypothetical protein
MRRDDMDVHKIQIAPWLMQKLELKKLTHPTKQQAIDALKEALVQNEFMFSIERRDSSMNPVASWQQ